MSHSCQNCHMTCDGSSSIPPILDPRILALLQSNRPPSASEEVTFRHVQRTGSTRFLELRSSIAELQKNLKSLVHERNQLEWIMEHTTEILNPVRHLPEDVLCEIFRHCLSPTRRQTSGYSSFHRGGFPPWTLVSVCRMWRQIALSFPHLWAQVHFNICIMPESIRAKGQLSKSSPNHCFFLHERIMKRLNLQLQRSTSVPLDISFICDVHIANEGTSHLWPLIASSHRWKRLLTSVSGLTLEPFWFIQDSISALETLEIVKGPPISSYRPVHLLSATNLRHLIIDSVGTGPDIRELRLPWAQLTTLTLRGVISHLTEPQIVRVLLQMSSLHSLAFTSQLLPRDIQEDTPAVPVVLANITRLSCVIVQVEMLLDSESSNSMLSLLILPVLNHLDIPYKNIQSYTAAIDAGDDVVHMLQRSNCALKTLKLSVSDPMIPDPLHLLQCDSSSSLEEISIFEFPFHRIRDILSHPYVTNNTAPFLPKLRSIEVDVSFPSLTSEEYELFEDYIRWFLESREAGGAALNSLHIHSQVIYTMSEFFKGCLLSLCERGLRFYISRYDLSDPRPF